MESRQEKPIINSYNSKPFLINQNTRFSDQQQFKPILTQQPIAINKPAMQQSQSNHCLFQY